MSQRVRRTGQRIKYNYMQRTLGFRHMTASCSVHFVSLFLSGCWEEQRSLGPPGLTFSRVPSLSCGAGPRRVQAPLSPLAPAQPLCAAPQARPPCRHKNTFACCGARVVRKRLVFLRTPRLCRAAVIAALTALAALASVRGVRRQAGGWFKSRSKTIALPLLGHAGVAAVLGPGGSPSASRGSVLPAPASAQSGPDMKKSNWGWIWTPYTTHRVLVSMAINTLEPEIRFRLAPLASADFWAVLGISS